jgi:hypothetical protein
VVGRHFWGADALVYVDDPRVEGGVAYRYRGWGNPILDVAAAQFWSVEAGEGTLRTETGDLIGSALFQREQALSASLSWLRRHWRSTAWLSAGGELRDLDFVWEDPEEVEALGVRIREFPSDLGATLEAGYSTVRGYPYSVSPQDGFLLSAGLQGHRFTRPLEGEEDAPGYLRLTGHGRGYRGFALPGFARHVLALRLDAGADAGDRSPGFSVGGTSGRSVPIPVDLGLSGRRLGFPVRGYDEGVQRGTRAFSATAEYRFPLWLVERGIGVLPFFLDRLWGDLFADAGSAWCPDECTFERLQAFSAPDPIYSVGGELILDLDVGYFVELQLRGGAAVPLSRVEGAGGARERPSPRFYLRLGRSF